MTSDGHTDPVIGPRSHPQDRLNALRVDELTAENARLKQEVDQHRALMRRLLDVQSHPVAVHIATQAIRQHMEKQ